jgi:hypothetical protein
LARPNEEEAVTIPVLVALSDPEWVFPNDYLQELLLVKVQALEPEPEPEHHLPSHPVSSVLESANPSATLQTADRQEAALLLRHWTACP